MKVTDLKENECIHCETEEQAIDICKLMNDAGLRWKSGKSYLSKNSYHVYESETCYSPAEQQYADLDYAKENNYTIYKAEQFLTKNTEILITIVNINPDTSEINITPQEGFEIYLENSDLKNGKVLFKEVKKKYPDSFIIPNIMDVEELFCSEKYKKLGYGKREETSEIHQIIVNEFEEMKIKNNGKNIKISLDFLAKKYGYSCGQAVRNIINNFHKKNK